MTESGLGFVFKELKSLPQANFGINPIVVPCSGLGGAGAAGVPSWWLCHPGRWPQPAQSVQTLLGLGFELLLVPHVDFSKAQLCRDAPGCAETGAAQGWLSGCDVLGDLALLAP